MEITLYSILIITLVVIVYVIFVYNNLVRLKNRVEETWRQIDVRLQNRYDLLPDLIQAVEKATSTDQEIQTKIAELRSAINNAKNIDTNNLHNISNKVKAENSVQDLLKGLQVSVEAYPELRSQESIQRFMNETTIIEEKIAASRQIYNVSAREYNEGIQIFPNNLIAKLFNFEKVDYFESSQEAKQDIRPNWSPRN